MEYISKDNIKCKAIMYKGPDYIKDFIQQIFDNDMNVVLNRRYINTSTFILTICTTNENKEVSQSLTICHGDYLVKAEDLSTGSNGYLVMPKDAFEFVFKEKGEHDEI